VVLTRQFVAEAAIEGGLMIDHLRDDTVRLGLLGPWRRWQDLKPGDRTSGTLVQPLSCAAGALVGALVFYLLGFLVGDSQGIGSAVFFAVWMFVVVQYQPEVVHLWHKIADDS
jgi:hypothetical protein